MLRAAQGAEKLTERVVILKQAVEANPASVTALLELGRAHRGLAQYDDAVAAFTRALRLAPSHAEAHRELGVTYSKSGQPQLAATELKEAVRLDPKDAEAWSTLGGALRRIGMSGAPTSYDKDALSESRESYAKAHSLNTFDLYSGLNVARLDLLLSKWGPMRATYAKNGFSNQVFLCRHMVQQTPKDFWRRFDLGDALLFSGNYDKARAAYDKAIALVPADERSDAFRSVLGPLGDYITARVLDPQLLSEVRVVIEKLEAATVKAG